MSFHLAYVDNRVLLDSSRPIVKAHERTAFADAVEVLAETKALRSRALADGEAARDDGRSAGLEEAKAEARQVVAASLTDVAATINAHAEARRADIAEAAFAAARAIIGDLDDTDVMQRIVDRTLARLDGDKPVTIEVAPAVANALTKHTEALDHVTVTENPDFGPTDCRIHSAQGQIIASLSVQFNALAARWGLTKAEA